MGIGQYILDEDGNPHLERNLLKWAVWLERSHKSKGKDNVIVARDYIGDVRIATDFLGLDFNFKKVGLPLLWETMIFGGEHDGYTRRFTSRALALDGHREARELVELERMVTLGDAKQ